MWQTWSSEPSVKPLCDHAACVLNISVARPNASCPCGHPCLTSVTGIKCPCVLANTGVLSLDNLTYGLCQVDPGCFV